MTFWQTKTLSELSDDEWESLCDGCGKCCLHKLEDEDTDKVHYTSVACRLLDLNTCRCTNYPERLGLVPDCLAVRQMSLAEMAWLPSTCAYRLIAEGKDLPNWHPLVSGTALSVVDAGVSIKSYAVSEGEVGEDEMEEYVIEWLD